MSEATDEELEEYQALADIECEFGLEHYDQDDYVGGIIGEVYKNRKRIQRLEGAIRENIHYVYSESFDPGASRTACDELQSVLDKEARG